MMQPKHKVEKIQMPCRYGEDCRNQKQGCRYLHTVEELIAMASQMSLRESEKDKPKKAIGMKDRLSEAHKEREQRKHNQLP
jgi:hypothetical protein